MTLRPRKREKNVETERKARIDWRSCDQYQNTPRERQGERGKGREGGITTILKAGKEREEPTN